MIIDIVLGEQDVRLDIDEDYLKSMLDLAEEFNVRANDLSSNIQLFCSDVDRKKCRRYFGELMGDVISELIIPIRSALEKDIG